MMQQPPSSLPNFTMPPPGFPNFISSDNSGPPAGGNQASDSNQELWVETKSGDGKVLMCYLTVINYLGLLLIKFFFNRLISKN